MAKPKIISQLDGEQACKILLVEDATNNMEAVTKQQVQAQIDAIAIYDGSVS